MTRADFRDRLLECLGGDWPEPSPLKVKYGEARKGDGYSVVQLTYEAEPDDPIPAILFDSQVGDQREPGSGNLRLASAQWSVASGQERTSGPGRRGNASYGRGTRQNWDTSCSARTRSVSRSGNWGTAIRDAIWKQFLFLKYVVAGKCMAWKNILDMRRAVDMLTSRDEVDSNRLGCYGHSMGSTHAWLVGPWEPRLKAIVGNCCLPTCAAIHDKQLLHCFPNFIPGIQQFGDTPDIAGLNRSSCAPSELRRARRRQSHRGSTSRDEGYRSGVPVDAR